MIWSTMKLFCLPFLASLVLVLAMTPPLKTLLVHCKMVDMPSARRINKKPIPRGGGIAIFLSVNIVLLLWYFVFIVGDFTPWESQNQFVVTLLAGLNLLLFGVADDAFNISPMVKLLGQIISASIMSAAGVRFGNLGFLPASPLLDFTITIIWYVIIINAFNLIDGLDGLASGLALLASLGLTICLASRNCATHIIPLAILAGACTGFLKYNFNPASIFLGDSGSMSLGFWLATVPLLTGGRSALIASLGVPLLIIGVPVFDTTLAIWRRSMRAVIASASGDKEKVLSGLVRPDMEHLHHRLLAMGFSQKRVAMLLYLLNVIFIAIAVILSLSSDDMSGVIFLGGLLVIAIIASHISRIELWDTGRAFFMTVSRVNFLRYLCPIYLVADSIALVATWFISELLAYQYNSGYAATYFFSIFPVYFTSIIFAMFVSGIYQRVWNKSCVRDFIALVAAIIGGWTIATATLIIVGRQDQYPGFDRHSAIFLIISLVPTILTRMLRIITAQYIVYAKTKQLRTSNETRRILLYGAGEHYLVLDTMMRGSLLFDNRHIVVGIIDDNPLLRKKIVRGAPVVGDISSIHKIIRNLNPHDIYITAKLTEKNFKTISDVARQYGLGLYELSCDIRRHIEPRELSAKQEEYL